MTKQKRNIHNQFDFLPHPIFIVTTIKAKKIFYKCFRCLNLFPIKYRLSRHFIYSKCIKRNNRYNNRQIYNKYLSKNTKKNFIITDSILSQLDKKFIKQKRIISIYPNSAGQEYFAKSLNIKYDNKITFSFINDILKNDIIFDKKNLLGEGHFGEVYSLLIKDNNSFLALKTEKNAQKSIFNEASILRQLKGIEGVPKIFGFINNSNNNIIFENLFGPSLDKLHFFCNNKFTEKTILNIGIQIIKILRDLHCAGFIHRDIKPQNICYGKFNKNYHKFLKTLNIIDFGLSIKYNNYSFRNNMANKTSHFVGSLFFASTSALSGFEQKPKDDLESLFYVLIYLKKGDLPWINCKTKDLKQFCQDILKIHESMPIEELLHGFCNEFKFVFKSIKNLTPLERPDYEAYINNLELGKHFKTTCENISESKMDWEIKLEQLNKSYKKLNLKKRRFIKNWLFNKRVSNIYRRFFKNF